MSDNIKVGICRCHRHYTPSYIYKTVVLKPNYCCHDNKNILTQEQLSEKNVKYVIKYNFSLGGETITVPENCILEFDGGSLSSGTIVGQNTVFINVGDVDIWGDNLTKEGTWTEHSGGGGGEPSEYIKDASISLDGNTLTLTKKDETTVTFTPDGGGGSSDKPYDPEAHSGLGRKTLKLKENNNNILTSEDFDKENTIYIISYDFDLNDENIILPEGCVLDFEGGSISNGSLSGVTDIINIPSDFLGVVDCSNLYINTEKHLNASDLSDTNDFYTEGDSFIGQWCEQNVKGTNYLYEIGNTDKIYYSAVGEKIPSGIRYLFYNKNFTLISKTRIITDYETAVPNGSKYVAAVIYFNIEDINDIYNIAKNIYFNFLSNNSVYIDEDLKFNPTLRNYYPISVVDVSYVYIEHARSSDVYKRYFYYPDHSASSVCIPYSTFKNFDYVRIVPNATQSGMIHFLKKEPTQNLELAEYSSYYSEPTYIAPGLTRVYYKIPEDAKYIMVFISWGNVNRAPESIHLCTAAEVNASDWPSNEFIESSLRNVNNYSMKLIHWNMGNFSNGGGETAINDDNYAVRSQGFKNFFANHKDCNFVFNEYNPVFARLSDRTVYTNSELFGLYSYSVGNYVRCNNTDELAQASLNNLVGHKVGVLNSMAGMFSQDGGYYVSPKPYVIYRYYMGGGSLYVINTHLATRLSRDQYMTIFRELVSIASGLSHVIITGDMNCSDRTAFSVFEDAGFTIANDNTPTHAGGVILDWIIYKSNSITSVNFEVCTDAVDSNNEMLSDHWPVAVTINWNNISYAPAIRGGYRFNPSTNEPEWNDGNNWFSNTINTASVTGTTSGSGNISKLFENFVVILSAWTSRSDTIISPFSASGGTGESYLKGHNLWYFNVKGTNGTVVQNTEVTVYYSYIKIK